MNKKNGKDPTTLFVGVDLGTSKTAVVTDNGMKETILSVVGWPKDIVARKFLKREILIGEDVMKNRLSLKISKPLEEGTVKDNPEDRKAAKELLNHSLQLAKSGKKYDKVFAIVGAPSQTDHINKTKLMEICRELTDSIMLVSEPFAVAYGIDSMNHSIIIDMGAGTIDLCRMHATLPEEGDEISLPRAGDHIDRILKELVEKDYKGASIPLTIARKWKEEHGFVGKATNKVIVDVPLEGKETSIDITEQVRAACESVMTDLIFALKGLISSYDSEFQSELKKNIILAGRLSQLDGAVEYIRKGLQDMGPVEIRKVEDIMFAGAEGACRLAKEMPEEYWTSME